MEKDIKKRTQIKIDVGLDENHLPLEMKWDASDGGGKGDCKAFMLAMWDRSEENTMRIDLWDKEMSIFEMQRFFHQTFMTMSDTYERATGKKPEAEAIRKFAREFAEKAGILG